MSNKNNVSVHEHWGSRLGVILAVSGSAIGLGNFLRFPGQAATHGGGAFMIPYLIALIFVALPIAVTEWTLGRRGGREGRHSPMGIYYEASGRRPFYGIVGGISTFTAFTIDMYYIFVEGWCLLYALQYLGALLRPLQLGFSLIPGQSAGLDFYSSAEYQSAFDAMCGSSADGALFSSGGTAILSILVLCMIANFWLIYRGVSKGIERFCKAVAPLILICSFIIVARVLTLGNPTGLPGRSLLDGLGFMWNPQNASEALRDPEVWLAATSQIFFSTSLCTSAVVTYASYIRSNQDVALSSVTATMANEFCEVCLGGLMIVPPAIMFLGAAATNPETIGSSFSLGFVVLPNVFAQMPYGDFFGFTFFLLLFFAAITSSISQLQPAVAFVKDAFDWNHLKSVLTVAVVILIGTLTVCYFTRRLVALDVFDFWGANFTPFVCAMFQTTLAVFVLGKTKFCEEADRGAVCKLAKYVYPIAKYASLPYLAIVFAFWIARNFKGRLREITSDNSVMCATAILFVFFIVLVWISVHTVERWNQEAKNASPKNASPSER